jgi:hypothetical protein
MFDRRDTTLIFVSIIVITIILVVATNTSLIYAQNQTKYAAKLVGVSVVPPVNTSAAGRAIFYIGNDWLWWKLNVTGITDPIMAHIHMGKKGVNGPIVADLLRSANFENTTERMIITGNISASDLQGPMKGKNFTDIQSAIKAHKTVGLHIDLHTNNYPDGELRGPVKIQNGSATTPVANKVDAAPIS